MNTLSEGDKKMISWIMAKVHISTTNKEVIRDFYNRMQGKGYDRSTRKAVYTYALQCHKENINLYNFVMG